MRNNFISLSFFVSCHVTTDIYRCSRNNILRNAYAKTVKLGKSIEAFFVYD